MNDNEQTQPELYPLDEAGIEMIAQLEEQGRQIQVAHQTILQYFLKQHKLPGRWKLADNKREIIKLTENDNLNVNA
jgi:hypothetical protein